MGATRNRLLVLEGDAEFSRALALEFSQSGYDVRVERDPPAALLAAREWGPEVVVLDLGPPTLDAIELCRRLRRVSWAAIVILTAGVSVEDRVRGSTRAPTTT